MGHFEKQDYIREMWKKTYIKSRASVHILRLFNDLSRKIYLFGISKNLNEIQEDEKISKYIIRPTDRFKTFWNVISLFMMIYTILIMPYRVAFVNDDTFTSAGAIVDFMVDFLFAGDILGNLLSHFLFHRSEFDNFGYSDFFHSL